MIAINAREKELIMERYPDIHIVRTVKQKSHRHRYFCVETPGVMELIAELRGYEISPKKSRRSKKQPWKKDRKDRGVDHRA